jgi:DNA-binding response OmpR family regulator
LSHIKRNSTDGDRQFLRVYMRALRQKLGHSLGKNNLIKTEMGIGYRLVADD